MADVSQVNNEAPQCPRENPFTDEQCPHREGHPGLHGEHPDLWFYDDPALEQKRRDASASFRRGIPHNPIHGALG